MEVDDTLSNFLKNLMVTNIISRNEFVSLIRADNDFTGISESELYNYYDLYKERDRSNSIELETSVKNILDTFRQTSLEDLKLSQVQSTHSLEDIVIALYRVGILLETRTNVLNETILEQVKVIRDFKEMASFASNDSMSNIKILDMLEKYKMLLNKLDDVNFNNRETG